MIYVFEPSSTLMFKSSFCRFICSFTCFTLIFRFGFYRSIRSFTCSILILKSDFCRIVCGVGGSPFIYSICIFNFGVCRLSFKSIFCKKSVRFDVSSFIIIGRFVEPKNYEHRCNCSFAMVFKNDIFKKC
jgi:hypothetical protein